MEIKVFENNDVEIILVNDEPLFELYSTGKALGYSRWDGKTYTEQGEQKLYAYKSRIDNVIRNAEITPIDIDGDKYFNESQLYDFMLEANSKQCKPFRKWICNEVLPSIRQNGCYISDTATQEDIDFESLYGIRRIYDTFFNSNDVMAEYEKFYRLSKEKRANNHHAFNNQDRIKLSKKIVEALENKARFAYASREPIYKILSYQELQTKVQVDITRLSNKHNGGLRAQVTRKLNKLQTDYDTLFFEFNELKTQYEEVQDTTMNDILFRQGENKEYLVIPYRGFSNNDMYKVKNNAMKRTPAYNFYENNFPKYLLRNKTFTEGLDITKPMACELLYDHTKGYDVHNFIKATLDIVSRTLEFNDRLIRRVSCATHEIIEDNYANGKIYIKLYNIE